MLNRLSERAPLFHVCTAQCMAGSIVQGYFNWTGTWHYLVNSTINFCSWGEGRNLNSAGEKVPIVPTPKTHSYYLLFWKSPLSHEITMLNKYFQFRMLTACQGVGVTVHKELVRFERTLFSLQVLISSKQSFCVLDNGIKILCSLIRSLACGSRHRWHPSWQRASGPWTTSMSYWFGRIGSSSQHSRSPADNRFTIAEVQTKRNTIFLPVRKFLSRVEVGLCN